MLFFSKPTIFVLNHSSAYLNSACICRLVGRVLRCFVCRVAFDVRGCVRRHCRRCVDCHRLEFEPTTRVEDEAEDDDSPQEAEKGRAKDKSYGRALGCLRGRHGRVYE